MTTWVALTRTSIANVLVSGDRDLLALQGLDIEVMSPRQLVNHLDRGRQ